MLKTEQLNDLAPSIFGQYTEFLRSRKNPVSHQAIYGDKALQNLLPTDSGFAELLDYINENTAFDLGDLFAEGADSNKQNKLFEIMARCLPLKAKGLRGFTFDLFNPALAGKIFAPYVHFMTEKQLRDLKPDELSAKQVLQGGHLNPHHIFDRTDLNALLQRLGFNHFDSGIEKQALFVEYDNVNCAEILSYLRREQDKHEDVNAYCAPLFLRLPIGYDFRWVYINLSVDKAQKTVAIDFYDNGELSDADRNTLNQFFIDNLSVEKSIKVAGVDRSFSTYPGFQFSGINFIAPEQGLVKGRAEFSFDQALHQFVKSRDESEFSNVEMVQKLKQNAEIKPLRKAVLQAVLQPEAESAAAKAIDEAIDLINLDYARTLSFQEITKAHADLQTIKQYKADEQILTAVSFELSHSSVFDLPEDDSLDYYGPVAVLDLAIFSNCNEEEVRLRAKALVQLINEHDSEEHGVCSHAKFEKLHVYFNLSPEVRQIIEDEFQQLIHVTDVALPDSDEEIFATLRQVVLDDYPDDHDEPGVHLLAENYKNKKLQDIMAPFQAMAARNISLKQAKLSVDPNANIWHQFAKYKQEQAFGEEQNNLKQILTPFLMLTDCDKPGQTHDQYNQAFFSYPQTMARYFLSQYLALPAITRGNTLSNNFATLVNPGSKFNVNIGQHNLDYIRGLTSALETLSSEGIKVLPFESFELSIYASHEHFNFGVIADFLNKASQFSGLRFVTLTFNKSNGELDRLSFSAEDLKILKGHAELDYDFLLQVKANAFMDEPAVIGLCDGVFNASTQRKRASYIPDELEPLPENVETDEPYKEENDYYRSAFAIDGQENIQIDIDAEAETVEVEAEAEAEAEAEQPEPDNQDAIFVSPQQESQRLLPLKNASVLYTVDNLLTSILFRQNFGSIELYRKTSPVSEMMNSEIMPNTPAFADKLKSDYFHLGRGGHLYADRMQKMTSTAYTQLLLYPFYFKEGLAPTLPPGFQFIQVVDNSGKTTKVLDYQETVVRPFSNLQLQLQNIAMNLLKSPAHMRGSIEQLMSGDNYKKYQEQEEAADKYERIDQIKNDSHVTARRFKKLLEFIDSNKFQAVEPLLDKLLGDNGLFKDKTDTLIDLHAVLFDKGLDAVITLLKLLDNMQQSDKVFFNHFVKNFIKASNGRRDISSLLEAGVSDSIKQLMSLSEEEKQWWLQAVDQHFGFDEQGYSSTGYYDTFQPLFNSFMAMRNAFKASRMKLPKIYPFAQTTSYDGNHTVVAHGCDNMVIAADRLLKIYSSIDPQYVAPQENYLQGLDFSEEGAVYAVEHGYHFVHPEMELTPTLLERYPHYAAMHKKLLGDADIYEMNLSLLSNVCFKPKNYDDVYNEEDFALFARLAFLRSFATTGRLVKASKFAKIVDIAKLLSGEEAAAKNRYPHLFANGLNFQIMPLVAQCLMGENRAHFRIESLLRFLDENHDKGDINVASTLLLGLLPTMIAQPNLTQLQGLFALFQQDFTSPHHLVEFVAQHQSSQLWNTLLAWSRQELPFPLAQLFEKSNGQPFAQPSFEWLTVLALTAHELDDDVNPLEHVQSVKDIFDNLSAAKQQAIANTLTEHFALLGKQVACPPLFSVEEIIKQLSDLNADQFAKEFAAELKQQFVKTAVPVKEQEEDNQSVAEHKTRGELDLRRKLVEILSLKTSGNQYIYCEINAAVRGVQSSLLGFTENRVLLDLQPLDLKDINESNIVEELTTRIRAINASKAFSLASTVTPGKFKRAKLHLQEIVGPAFSAVLSRLDSESLAKPVEQHVADANPDSLYSVLLNFIKPPFGREFKDNDIVVTTFPNLEEIAPTVEDTIDYGLTVTPLAEALDALTKTYSGFTLAQFRQSDAYKSIAAINKLEHKDKTEPVDQIHYQDKMALIKALTSVLLAFENCFTEYPESLMKLVLGFKFTVPSKKEVAQQKACFAEQTKKLNEIAKILRLSQVSSEIRQQVIENFNASESALSLEQISQLLENIAVKQPSAQAQLAEQLLAVASLPGATLNFEGLQQLFAFLDQQATDDRAIAGFYASYKQDYQRLVNDINTMREGFAAEASNIARIMQLSDKYDIEFFKDLYNDLNRYQRVKALYQCAPYPSAEMLEQLKNANDDVFKAQVDVLLCDPGGQRKNEAATTAFYQEGVEEIPRILDDTQVIVGGERRGLSSSEKEELAEQIGYINALGAKLPFISFAEVQQLAHVDANLLPAEIQNKPISRLTKSEFVSAFRFIKHIYPYRHELPAQLKRNIELKAIALVREAVYRAVESHGHHLHPRLVQLMPLIFADYNSTFSEVKTGQGKTLITAMSLIMMMLEGNPVDVCSSNEFLVSEAYSENLPLFELLDIPAAFIKATSPRSAYADKGINFGSLTAMPIYRYRLKAEVNPLPSASLVLDEADAAIFDTDDNYRHTVAAAGGKESKDAELMCLVYDFVRSNAFDSKNQRSLQHLGAIYTWASEQFSTQGVPAYSRETLQRLQQLANDEQALGNQDTNFEADGDFHYIRSGLLGGLIDDAMKVEGIITRYDEYFTFSEADFLGELGVESVSTINVKDPKNGRLQSANARFSGNMHPMMSAVFERCRKDLQCRYAKDFKQTYDNREDEPLYKALALRAKSAKRFVVQNKRDLVAQVSPPVMVQRYLQDGEGKVKVGGLTGTLASEWTGQAAEKYGVNAVKIPQHKQSQLVIHPSEYTGIIYKKDTSVYGKERKIINFDATKQLHAERICAKIQELRSKNLPVVIFAKSVAEIEDLEQRIKLMLPQDVETQTYKQQSLNEDDRRQIERDIIKKAGQPGVVTFTNALLGRGTDIKTDHLSIIKSSAKGEVDDRGAYQEYGRAGRNGKPGDAYTIISALDFIEAKTNPVTGDHLGYNHLVDINIAGEIDDTQSNQTAVAEKIKAYREIMRLRKEPKRMLKAKSAEYFVAAEEFYFKLIAKIVEQVTAVDPSAETRKLVIEKVSRFWAVEYQDIIKAWQQFSLGLSQEINCVSLEAHERSLPYGEKEKCLALKKISKCQSLLGQGEQSKVKQYEKHLCNALDANNESSFKSRLATEVQRIFAEFGFANEFSVSNFNGIPLALNAQIKKQGVEYHKRYTPAEDYGQKHQISMMTAAQVEVTHNPNATLATRQLAMLEYLQQNAVVLKDKLRVTSGNEVIIPDNSADYQAAIDEALKNQLFNLLNSVGMFQNKFVYKQNYRALLAKVKEYVSDMPDCVVPMYEAHVKFIKMAFSKEMLEPPQAEHYADIRRSVQAKLMNLGESGFMPAGESPTLDFLYSFKKTESYREGPFWRKKTITQEVDVNASDAYLLQQLKAYCNDLITQYQSEWWRSADRKSAARSMKRDISAAKSVSDVLVIINLQQRQMAENDKKHNEARHNSRLTFKTWRNKKGYSRLAVTCAKMQQKALDFVQLSKNSVATMFEHALLRVNQVNEALTLVEKSHSFAVFSDFERLFKIARTGFASRAVNVENIIALLKIKDQILPLLESLNKQRGENPALNSCYAECIMLYENIVQIDSALQLGNAKVRELYYAPEVNRWRLLWPVLKPAAEPLKEDLRIFLRDHYAQLSFANVEKGSEQDLKFKAVINRIRIDLSRKNPGFKIQIDGQPTFTDGDLKFTLKAMNVQQSVENGIVETTQEGFTQTFTISQVEEASFNCKADTEQKITELAASSSKRLSFIEGEKYKQQIKYVYEKIKQAYEGQGHTLPSEPTETREALRELIVADKPANHDYKICKFFEELKQSDTHFAECYDENNFLKKVIKPLVDKRYNIKEKSQSTPVGSAEPTANDQPSSPQESSWFTRGANYIYTKGTTFWGVRSSDRTTADKSNGNSNSAPSTGNVDKTSADNSSYFGTVSRWFSNRK